MNRIVLLAALCATLAVGCESTSTQRATDNEDKVYVTGSRIPRNDRNSSGVKSTSDQKSISDMMKPPASGRPGN